MKTTSLSQLALSVLAAALLAAAPSLGAAEPKQKAEKSTAPAATADAAKRPPLKIAVDTKPIDRNAPDRVSYAPIVKRTSASVVYVYSSKKVRAPDLSQFFSDPMLRRFFNLPDDALPGPGGESSPLPLPGPNRNNRDNRGGSGSSRSRAPEQTQEGLGSGVIVTADGYILTNNHIVDGADDVKVAIGESSKRHDAKVVGRDPLSDIAVLKIEATNLSPATFGDSEQLQIGDVVLAIGNPFGVGQSVSRGIVSALSRGVGIGPFEDFIQTDAAINPGNSGGALLDSQGRIVGINTAILSRSGGFNGVGFAIPINLARNVAEQIVNHGRVDRGFLGVSPQDLDEDLAAQFGTDKGALITEVTPDSPGEKAGLKSGDVITKIDAVEIRDGRHLRLTVSQLAPDSQIEIGYLRDGRPATTNATLARRTIDSPGDTDTSIGGEDVGVLNGVGVSDISSELRQQMNIPARIKGALVTSVEPDSPSARQGLREGDVILELDRKPVNDAAGAVKLSEEIEGPKVMVLLWRNGRTQFVVVDESK